MQIPRTISPDAARPRPRILIADDSAPMLESVSGLLSADFDVVATASHGVQAVELALRHQPDIAVLDVAMPGFDGFQAALTLRQHGLRTRVVFLTMHRADEFVSAAMRAGGHGFVVKSRLSSDLAGAIDHALDGRRFVPSLTSLSTLAGGQHTTQFHMNDRFFLDEVSRFVASRLRSGEPVVVVTGDTTRSGLADRLHALGLDSESLVSRGLLVMEDSAAALARVMRNGRPDRGSLVEMVDGLERRRVASASGPGCRLNLVGDITVSLCRHGDVESAIEIERIWDDLTHGMPLFTVCSYPVECFERRGTTTVFGDICAVHSAVTHTPDTL